MTRVLVVDDHPLWRDAVVRDLEGAGYAVVGTAGDGAKALRVAAATRPDVVVLDLQLPDLSGVEVAARLRMHAGAAADGGARPYVLVLSASGEHADVLAAVAGGATGYLVKSATREELLDAVARTARGEAVFTPGLAGLVLGAFERREREQQDEPHLTPREVEVLRLVATGRSYKQIAEQLVVSHRTVQNHVQRVLEKLQLHNRVQLTRYAIERGLDAD